MTVASVPQVLAALKAGTITAQEADAYLRSEHRIALADVQGNAQATTPMTAPAVQAPAAVPTTPPPAIQPPVATPTAPPPGVAAATEARRTYKAWPVLAILLFAIFGLTWLAFQTNDTPAGLVTLEIPETSSGASYPLTDAITALQVSGTLTGEGTATITFDTGTQTYTVATITSDPGTPRTAKASYQPGDTVEIEHAPAVATYYLDDGEASTPIDLPFTAPDVDTTLLIVADESGTITTYRLPIVIGEQPRATAFTDVCEETCGIPATNGTVIVTITGDATMALTLRPEIAMPNRAPELLIPYTELVVDGMTTLELSGRFNDPDEDALLYSVGSSDLVDATVDGTILTLTPHMAGTDTLIIYASDLTELVSAPMAIRVLPTTEPVIDNTTVNETTPETNQTEEVNGTIEEPAIGTNATETNTTLPDATPTINLTNGTLDCSNPDPNLRPLDCLTQPGSRYFEEDVLIEDVARNAVARITPIGNLLITGDVIYGSVGTPSPEDFAIGERDSDLDYVAVLWIDSTTGDLHLRGSLFEEDEHLEPTSGSYAVRNARGIVLLYADKTTGDLHLRGNLIPYRRSVTG